MKAMPGRRRTRTSRRRGSEGAGRRGLLEKEMAAAGKRWGQRHVQHDPTDTKAEVKAMSEAFTKQWISNGRVISPDKLPAILKAGRAFREGWRSTKGKVRGSDRLVMLPLRREAGAVVVGVRDPILTAAVLQELCRLPLAEITVVHSGAASSLPQPSSMDSRVTVVYHPDDVQEDVERAIGAKLARTESLLFVHGGLVLSAEQLAPYLLMIEAGADAVLCDYHSTLGLFTEWDGPARVTAFVNTSIGRADLGANSLHRLPHALSRQALQHLSSQQLMVPAKAQTALVAAGLTMKVCGSIPISSVRKRESADLSRLRLGDYVEALHQAIEIKGSRLSLTDGSRKRLSHGRQGL
ncbi:hypothetical protein ACFO9Q_21230 [Paenibacillus sp. GCM10023252]|uniref:hypothetical protein n=1 Tax=Paenibacillus sp. GCM10023252 TaxID=3252649 RepID=UPI0036203AB7